MGRSQIWSHLMKHLDQPRGSVVLIGGEPGSGRSHLLRKFGEAAAERGIRAVGCADSSGIERTTKLPDVARILVSLLAGDGEQPNPARPPRGDGSLLRRLVESVGAATANEREIFDLLSAAAPVVVGIDGYLPSATMDLWFANRLIPRVRAAGSLTVLVITGQPAAFGSIRSAATEALELAPFDQDEVRAYLQEIGAELNPALSEAELAGYCEAVVADPRLLRWLGTVFSAMSDGPR